MTKEDFSWEKVDKACEKIALQLKKKKIRAIYGIPRGGLVLAVKLSHLLNVPIVMGPSDADAIVDEICDSGKTLTECRKKYPGAVFASIHLNERCCAVPDIYIHKTKNWIVYPWEK